MSELRIRRMTEHDIETIKEIFNRCYPDNIELPNYNEHFITRFIVEDGKKIISAGGIRLIPEICIVTDKGVPARTRIKALNSVKALASIYLQKLNFQWLHVTTDDAKWASQMKRKGALSRGEALEFFVGSE